jgi:hypothetical protein
MKKSILSIGLLLLAIVVYGQDRYMTRTGHISFFSNAPLENIEAHNYQVNSILDVSNGELAFSVLMRGFQFEKALMQEHFNENFVESHIYPRASFSGRIVDFDKSMIERHTENQVEVTGELTIHGVTRNITVDGTIQRQGNSIVAKSSFPVRVADYDIRVPSVVRNNIAEVVDVTVEISLQPMENQ